MINQRELFRSHWINKGCAIVVRIFTMGYFYQNITLDFKDYNLVQEWSSAGWGWCTPVKLIKQEKKLKEAEDKFDVKILNL